MVVLEPEALLTAVTVRPEVGVTAAVKESFAVLAGRPSAPVVGSVAVVEAVTVVTVDGMPFVLQVVAALGVPLVVQVVVPPVDLVPVVPPMLEVVMPAMQLVPQVAAMLQVPVMVQAAAPMREVPLVFEVVVAAVVQMPPMDVTVMDPVPMMPAVPTVVPPTQRRTDLGPG